MVAKDITADIRWIMEDNRLDHAPDFKVQTKRVGDSFVTVVYGVDGNRSRQALAEYASNTAAIELRTREFDGFLSVIQPASAS